MLINVGRQIAEDLVISTINEEKVNHAIRDCLDLCRGREANELIAQIAAFLAGLKSSGWNRDEIREVDLAVHRILHAVVDTTRLQKDKTDPEHDQVIS
jgi:hypothetical protein